VTRADVTGERASVARDYLVDDAERIGVNFMLDGETKVNVMIRGGRGAWVRIMNAIAAVLQRVQQTLFKLPRDQLSHGIVLEARRSEVLDRGNPCLGEYDDLNVHE
jgi:hypothetical protein